LCIFVLDVIDNQTLLTIKIKNKMRKTDLLFEIDDMIASERNSEKLSNLKKLRNYIKSTVV